MNPFALKIGIVLVFISSFLICLRLAIHGFIWNRIQIRKISFPYYERMVHDQRKRGLVQIIKMPIEQFKQSDSTLYYALVLAKINDTLLLVVGFIFLLNMTWVRR